MKEKTNVLKLLSQIIYNASMMIHDKKNYHSFVDYMKIILNKYNMDEIRWSDVEVKVSFQAKSLADRHMYKPCFPNILSALRQMNAISTKK